MSKIYNDTPNTLLSGTNSADTILNGGYGGDVWHVGGSNVTINAKNGNDYIRNLKGGSQSSINAGDGDDTIENEGADFVKINGGSGNDSIANTIVYVGDGTGFVYPNYAKISGGAGNDSIYNDGGANVLFQYAEGDGNDVIYGFKANSTLSIGGGTYSTKKSGDNVIVTVGTGKISLMGAASLSKVNINGTKATSTTLTVTDKTKSPVTVGSAIKTINASKRTTAVKITGNNLANKITGGSGNDSIYGGDGNDIIYGNAGSDKLYGQNGNDKLFGDAGNDSLSGGDGKDTLSGGNNNDKLLGGAGNDCIKGGDGKDTLSGGSGDDKLLGGAGNDCIKGGSGNDSLWGGTGNDTLWGDAGNDKFFYSKGDGKDTIFGFENGDTLTFDNITFKTSMASYKKSNGTLTLNVSGGSITFKEFTASTFHINNDTYKISGSTLKKQ